MISDLGERSLDAGSGAIFDRTISAWLVEWRERQDRRYDRRYGVDLAPQIERLRQGVTDLGEELLDRPPRPDGQGTYQHPGQRRARFADPSAVIGRATVAHLLHWLLLAVLGATDVAVFYQVLAVLLRSNPGVLGPAVLGFSIASLALAHLTGLTLRDLRYDSPRAHAAIPVLTLAGWIVIGATACYLRLAPLPTSTVTHGWQGAATTPGREAGQPYAALTFAVMYLGSGLVAGLLAYWTRNLVAVQYARTKRGLDRMQRHQRRWQGALARRDAWATELREHVRRRIMGAIQDPRATQHLSEDQGPGEPGPPVEEKT